MAIPCPICGGLGILPQDDDDAEPCTCADGRRIGPLLRADQRKEVDKADAADELG
jgi:hypothetical protein